MKIINIYIKHQIRNEPLLLFVDFKIINSGCRLASLTNYYKIGKSGF